MASKQNMENFCINATSFVPEKDVRYTKPRINKSGGKSVGILNSNTNKQLMLSTPLMLTWGVSEFIDDKSGRRSYDMALQFPSGDYSNEQTNQFLNSIVEFQSKLKRDAVANSKEWLNKSKMTDEVVDALFHPMLKYPKDKNTDEIDLTRPPTLKVKLDYWDDQFSCEIFDLNQRLVFPTSDNTNLGPLDLIPKGTNVAVVIKCGGLWFANGKFGCTWKLEQAVVKPRETYKGRCLINLSTEETERLKTQKEEEDDDDDGQTLMLAEDTDVEEETIESTPTPAPMPEPTPTPTPALAPIFTRTSSTYWVETKSSEAGPASETPKTIKKKIVRRKKPLEAE